MFEQYSVQNAQMHRAKFILFKFLSSILFIFCIVYLLLNIEEILKLFSAFSLTLLSVKLLALPVFLLLLSFKYSLSANNEYNYWLEIVDAFEKNRQ